MPKRLAILVDGGFAKKRLGPRLGTPKVNEIETYIAQVLKREVLEGFELFRVYWYDAPPFEGVATNPVSKVQVRFAATPQASTHKSLLDGLEMVPYFAVRRGQLQNHGWRLKRRALREIAQTGRSVEADDLSPQLTQKGVDMRIGLDIACLALKRIVDGLLLVTGDSDFVPAMKLARKEGLIIYLDPIGQKVYQELRAHADVVL